MRDHLLVAYRMTNKLPAPLANEPDLPDSLLYLWRWFEELASRRSSNGFGLNPITDVDIDAWSRLHHIDLERWEVQVLHDLDRSFLRSMNEAQQAERKTDGHGN